MPGILDRLDTTVTLPAGVSRLAAHEVFSTLQFRALGQITDAEAHTILDLDADGISDYDWAKARYTAAAGASPPQEERFLSLLHSGMMLFRRGKITRQKLVDSLNLDL